MQFFILFMLFTLYMGVCNERFLAFSTNFQHIFNIFLIVRVRFALSYLNVGVDKIILHVGNFLSIKDFRFNHFSSISLDVYLLASFVSTYQR